MYMIRVIDFTCMYNKLEVIRRTVQEHIYYMSFWTVLRRSITSYCTYMYNQKYPPGVRLSLSMITISINIGVLT